MRRSSSAEAIAVSRVRFGKASWMVFSSKTLRWEMSPLHVNELHSAFFQGGERFPVKAAQFDCALLMRGIPHEWHEISDVPELAGAIQK
jgi:hypothetical protein